MTLIEINRKHLRQKEQISQLSREIFTTAMDILREQGALRKGYLFRRQGTRHTVSSVQPPIDIRIFNSRRNLEKSKIVYVRIKGVGMLDVKKKVSEGEEIFKAGEYEVDSCYHTERDGTLDPSEDEPRLKEYLAAAKKVQLQLKGK